jgi:hypothetical protein
VSPWWAWRQLAKRVDMNAVMLAIPSRPVEVLHGGRWVTGWLEAYRHDGDGWRVCPLQRRGRMQYGFRAESRGKVAASLLFAEWQGGPQTLRPETLPLVPV